MPLILLSSLIPTAVWLGYFLYAAPLRFIPKRTIALLIAIGAATAIVALESEQALEAIMQRSWDRSLLPETHPASLGDTLALAASVFLAIAPIEEFAKFLVLVPLLKYWRFFRNPLDGMMFGVALGLGMATVENWIVFSQYAVSNRETVFLPLFALRLVGSTLAHALYGAVLGYFIGQANASRLWRRRFLRQGLAASILMHGIFNFFLFAEFGVFSFLGLIAVLAMTFRWYTDRKNFLDALVTRSTEALRTLSLPDQRELENTVLQSFPAHLLVAANICPGCFRTIKGGLARCPLCGAGLSSSLRNPPESDGRDASTIASNTNIGAGRKRTE